jgi:predicted dithiol-disulfide oxidoreductase (DUF899 family)
LKAEHKTGTRDEFIAESKRILDREQELGREKAELVRQRRELPWVRVDKEYTLDSEDGPKSLAQLFDGRSQLLVYHIMFGPSWTAACPGCSALVDHFDPMLPHLNARDVTLICVSHAPIDKIRAFKKRMGWHVPYASSFRSDFNYDFGASFTKEQQPEIAKQVLPQFEGDPSMAEMAASCGIDVREYVTTEAPGLDAFAVERDGAIYHTFTSVPFGSLEVGFEQYLDRAPRGGKEGLLMRHHDMYQAAATGSRASR